MKLPTSHRVIERFRHSRHLSTPNPQTCACASVHAHVEVRDGKKLSGFMIYQSRCAYKADNPGGHRAALKVVPGERLPELS